MNMINTPSTMTSTCSVVAVASNATRRKLPSTPIISILPDTLARSPPNSRILIIANGRPHHPQAHPITKMISSWERGAKAIARACPLFPCNHISWASQFVLYPPPPDHLQSLSLGQISSLSPYYQIYLIRRGPLFSCWTTSKQLSLVYAKITYSHCQQTKLPVWSPEICLQRLNGWNMVKPPWLSLIVNRCWLNLTSEQL